jgi:hypothetical protein
MKNLTTWLKIYTYFISMAEPQSQLSASKLFDRFGETGSF